MEEPPKWATAGRQHAPGGQLGDTKTDQRTHARCGLVLLLLLLPLPLPSPTRTSVTMPASASRCMSAASCSGERMPAPHSTCAWAPAEYLAAQPQGQAGGVRQGYRGGRVGRAVRGWMVWAGWACRCVGVTRPADAAGACRALANAGRGRREAMCQPVAAAVQPTRGRLGQGWEGAAGQRIATKHPCLRGCVRARACAQSACAL